MSDTPISNASSFNTLNYDQPVVPLYIYQNLERQLAEVTKQRDALAEALGSIKRRSVIAGSVGEYRRGQLDALQSCREVADTALATLKGDKP